MGFITCCFHGSSENHARRSSASSETFTPLPEVAFPEAGGAPNVTEGKNSNVNGHVCKTGSSQYLAKDLSENAAGHIREVSAGEFRSGFGRALALQAQLCASGPSNTAPEARARGLVELILTFLNASSVRLYITGSNFSNSGSRDGVEGHLVQLAAAIARTHITNENHYSDLSSRPTYFCPRHEAAGAASMLLRRALVSKVPVVHRCDPKSEPACSRTALSSAPTPASTTTVSGRESAESATVATVAHCTPLRAITISNGSAYSQGPQPEHPPVQHQDRSKTATAAGCYCCPDLDLCEHDAIPGSPMLFAAIPIMYGASTLGVLWLATPAAPASATPSGSAEQDPPVRTLGSELSSTLLQRGDTTLPTSPSVAKRAGDTSQAAKGATMASAPAASHRSRSHPTAAAEVLSDAPAVQHLALSVSMALAAGATSLPHMCRLAGAMHQLAASSSLAELIGKLCSLLSDHVRRCFLADVVVQAALVPGVDARVAFILRRERGEAPTGSGPRSASVRRVMSQSRLRVASMCTPSATAPDPSGVMSNTVSGGVGRCRSVTYTPPTAVGKRSKHSMSDQQRGYTSVAGPVEATPPIIRPDSQTTLRRNVFILENSAARCDGALGVTPSANPTLNHPHHQPPSLSARAFRLSNTLLQAMLHSSSNTAHQRTSVPKAASTQDGSSVEASGRNNGVLPGLLVCDCARHIQDEHQPSRDVCMLMMAAGGTGGGGGSNHDGGRPSAVQNSHGGSATVQETTAQAAGAQALVLMGMETGDGAVLALYLAFPTPEPHQLLAGIRDSCSALMAEHLVELVRHRLASPDLAAEWETLRAGVPGAYVSVSRCSNGTAPDNVGTPVAAVNLCTAGSSCSVMAPLLLLSRQTSRCTTMLSDPAFSAEDAACLLAGGGSSSNPRHGAQFRESHKSVLGCVPSGSSPIPPSPTTPTATVLDLGAPNAPAPVDGGKHPSQNGHKNGPSPLAGMSRKSSLTAVGMVTDEVTLAAGPAAGGNWLTRYRRSVTATTNAVVPAMALAAAGSRSSSTRGMIARLGRALERDGGAPMQTSLDNNIIAPTAGIVGGGGGSHRQLSGAVVRRAIRHACGSNTADDDETGWLDVDITAAAIVSGPKAVGMSTGAAALLTVHDLDETYESWGMRAHMSALVESIMSTTLRNSGVHVLEDVGPGGETTAAACIVEGLEDLQLVAVLGQGASGVVLRGTLGCTPVAVKIMEMPDGDVSVRGKPGTDSGDFVGHRSKEVDDGDGEAGGRPAEGELHEVRARRALLRNAMEVALMRTISHVNIVQAFGVYDNVVMERHEARQGVISLRRVNLKDAADVKIADGVAGQSDGASPKTSSPICTAIVLELCDRGSLADVLYSRTFPPLPLPPPHPSTSAAATAGMIMQYARYWKGVYMTLLEIALALRHLHSRRLVHRDLKPGNVLLKSSPGDPRGWTCKLADFGFGLVLDRVGPQNLEDPPSHRSAASHSSATQAGGAAAAVPSAGGREHYAIQQHVGGTVTHMAPEAFRKGARIDTGVDVFSFGVIMWELVCSRGQRPYRELALDAIGDAVASGTRLVFPNTDHVPSAYRQLAKSCWARDARQRPSAAELVNAIKALLEAVKS